MMEATIKKVQINEVKIELSDGGLYFWQIKLSDDSTIDSQRLFTDCIKAICDCREQLSDRISDQSRYPKSFEKHICANLLDDSIR